MLLGGDAGGSGRGDFKEVMFMVVLLGGVIYHMLALLWILTFYIYTILCSHQMIYLNNYSVVGLSFDRSASILHNWDLSYLHARSISRLGK